MAAEVNVRRSARIRSFGVEPAANEPRRSSRVALFGLLNKQPCNILVKILSCIKERKLLIQNAMSLRSTSKEMKEKIDNRTDFVLPFLKLLGGKFSCDPWRNALNSNHWLSVCKDWLETPLKVVALDCSVSMDTPHTLGGPSHLQVALDILSNMFFEQQKALRSDMFVYVFAKDFVMLRIRNPKHLTKLIQEINTNAFGLQRQNTETKTVIEALITSENSPLNCNELIKKVSIEMISDHEFNDDDVETLINTLRKGASTLTNRNRKFKLNFIPTSEEEQYQNTWIIASEQLKSARRKRNVQISLNTTHSPKRIRIDPEEQE